MSDLRIVQQFIFYNLNLYIFKWLRSGPLRCPRPGSGKEPGYNWPKQQPWLRLNAAADALGPHCGGSAEVRTGVKSWISSWPLWRPARNPGKWLHEWTGEEEDVPVHWAGILDAFMEYEALAKLELYSCEKALNYFCILDSRSLHFVENSKSSFFIQKSLSEDFIFYLIFHRNLMGVCSLLFCAFYLKQHIYQYWLFLS